MERGLAIGVGRNAVAVGSLSVRDVESDENSLRNKNHRIATAKATESSKAAKLTRGFISFVSLTLK